MKKILLLAALMPFLVYAQDERVAEVCGVKFGSSYTSAKYILESRLGTADIDEDGYLVFINKSHAGITYDMIGFRFKSNMLNHVLFTFLCETKDDAKSKQKEMVDMMKNNYSLTQKTDQNGEIAYWGGTSPIEPNEYAFVIYIDRCSGFEGFPYMATLMYGPYGYGE